MVPKKDGQTVERHRGTGRDEVERTWGREVKWGQRTLTKDGRKRERKRNGVGRRRLGLPQRKGSDQERRDVPPRS